MTKRTDSASKLASTIAMWCQNNGDLASKSKGPKQMQTHITNPQQIFSEHESNEIPQKIDDVHFTTARAAS